MRVGLLLALVVTVLGLAAGWTTAPWVVWGPSMEPALRPGDHVMVDRWSYRQRLPRAGEVVLVIRQGTEPLVKRVAEARRTPAGIVVELRGDNAAHSADSRQLGPFAVEELRGRVVLRYWPPERWGLVR